MRPSKIVIAAVSAALFSSAAVADTQERKFSVGLTSYATTIDFPQGEDDASGIAVTAMGAFNPVGLGHIGFIANYAVMEHDTFSMIDITSIDASLIWGRNLTLPGFKFYVGGGFFSEKWKAGNFNQTFSGGQLTGGIGYNFDRVGLDLFVNARSGDSYEVMGTKADSAASAGLSISYRF